jgi:peptidoglycan/xylan/chitin deacetylase (PgdA/CDA1 family)
MSYYFTRIPTIIQKLFPNFTWKIKSEFVYLTFDDGPHPEYTPKILDILRERNIKATFFVLGDKCQEYPQILKQIENDGHAIGFHGHRHKKINDLNPKEFERLFVLPNELKMAKLFRPPYGRIGINASKEIQKRFKIILYSIVLGDFDSSVTVNKMLSRSKKIKRGDIVLLHDTKKTCSFLTEFLKDSHRYKFNSIT